MKLFSSKFLFIFLFACVCLPLAAQTKGKTNKRPVAKPTPSEAATPKPTPEAEPEMPATKRNGRPDADPTTKASATKAPVFVPVYFYTFTRPGFTYSRIAIEHDEAGKGQISFQRTEFDEAFIDPIDLSAVTMANIKGAVAALNFLSSTEEYQVARDYSHMGNIEFKVKKDGLERSVKYNWTENKNAKLLMDEYRRITNEYTWRFEIITARQNQPLLTPSLVELIESYVKRGEIADPPHLVPFLTELSNDERLPLMARNRAIKVIKEIEKTKKP